MKKENIVTELKEGYNNAQELIRFIDAKAGIMLGITGVFTAHSFNRIENFRSSLELACIPWDMFLILGLSILYIFFSIITFCYIFLCIKATGVLKETRRPHILFPLDNTNDFSIFAKELEQVSENHQFDELCAQVYNAGKILEKKIYYCNKAIKYLCFQLGTGVVVYLFNMIFFH